MALMNDLHIRSIASKAPAFNTLFKDVFGCGLFAVVLVGSVCWLTRSNFTFTGQLAALVAGGVLGAVGAILLERASSRH